jgi:DNA replication protein DnaC
MAQSDCPQCQGSGWKVVERTAQGAQPLAADKPGSVSQGEPKMVWAVPCDCTTGDRTERALQRARVPERYRHCDFENYETDNDIENVTREQLAAWNRSLTQAKMLVQRFAGEFPVGSEHGLLLMGPCGVGKTHLAVSAMKTIVLRGHSGLFYDYRELLKAIQDSYNPENQATEMSVLEPVLKTEILVLDDVGSSKPSLWALETVGHILNTRYNDKRTTIITTNYPDQPPGGSAPVTTAQRAIREETLGDRIGERMRSRLAEMCVVIEMRGADFRQRARRARFG